MAILYVAKRSLSEVCPLNSTQWHVSMILKHLEVLKALHDDSISDESIGKLLGQALGSKQFRSLVVFAIEEQCKQLNDCKHTQEYSNKQSWKMLYRLMQSGGVFDVSQPCRFNFVWIDEIVSWHVIH